MHASRQAKVPSSQSFCGLVGLAATLVLILLPAPARAIPAFARKYGTSCITCHTVFPKLNPFGEAFLRNGMRFPGNDAEMAKQEPVSLGSEAYKNLFPKAVWPGTLPSVPPLALSINGHIDFHPQTGSAGAIADHGAPVVLDHLIDEAHLWSGGSLTETITFFSELTASAGSVALETAQLWFNDLIGPAHALTLRVGAFVPCLSSFGVHSSYLADTLWPSIHATALLGGVDGLGKSWAPFDSANGLELRGTFAGRFDYAAGINQGVNAWSRAPDSVYGQIGFKLGGVRLDGEAGSGVPDPMMPWAETALTMDLYGFHSSSRFAAGAGGATAKDEANVIGAALRGQSGSLELDAGVAMARHDDANGNGLRVRTLQEFAELSYVVYPWLVPAIRVESTTLAPEQGAGLTDLRLSPGVAALLLPNLKLTLVGNFEHATGVPPGGWAGARGQATERTSLAVQGISLGLAYAY